MFLTNQFALPAPTICALYRCRWQVELFFKWIKQHLRIKRFYGTSENAVRTQIWIAISVYVLVAIIKKQLRLDVSLHALLQILSLTLFEKLPLKQAVASVEPFPNNQTFHSQLIYSSFNRTLLYVVNTFVKASGGCSAPMAKNPEEAMANLGQMRFRQFAGSSAGYEAQIMIRHPNNSGLQRDQITHLYIPLFIVRELRLWQGDQLLLEMQGGISISEDPNFRFSYRPNGAATFRAEAIDTEGHVFRGEWPAQPAG